MMGSVLGAVSELATAPKAFFDDVKNSLRAGARLVTFYGSPADDVGEVALTAVLHHGQQLRAARTNIRREEGFHSLTRDYPSCHVFEREVFEQFGTRPHDHPWLKPVRFPATSPLGMRDYPFFRIDGKEVHEVAVGPIHAGVIEPGHFRFMCLGETVHHLEVQLGYQHRNAERLLTRGPPLALTPLAETLAGDTSIGHAWAHCAAVEALAGCQVPEAVQSSRAIGLELERIAMHLAGLAGMATDIGFLQGSATYGRLRTTAINSSMLLCGSRFGRGWLRPGAARASMPEDVARTLKSNLALLRDDIAIINERFLASRTVRHRLLGVGIVVRTQAAELGLVGMAARACGISLDARTWASASPYERRRVDPVLEESGDCWARARIRIRETDSSLEWLEATLSEAGTVEPTSCPMPPLAPNSVAIGLCEGWRGEVVHVIETDAAGGIRRYRAQDPSLRNWHGLALALRGNDISDFPICNKSFDLSYCGNDL